MADTLRTRVGRVIAGSVHALLDRLEDQAPEATMEQALREAGAVIDDVRHELGQATANRHLAQQQHARLNGQHESLVDQVAQVLASGREDLAHAAVSRQLDIEDQLPVLETTLSDLARQEQELQGYVAALLAKQREMQEALARFRASRQAAAAPASPTAAGGGAAGRIGAAEAAFDRVHQRQTGLSVAAAGATMDQAAKLKALDDLVRERKIADRLASLKAAR